MGGKREASTCSGVFSEYSETYVKLIKSKCIDKVGMDSSTSGYSGQEKGKWICSKRSVFRQLHVMTSSLIPLMREITIIWSAIDTCRISRTILPNKSRRRTKSLFSFNKVSYSSKHHYELIECMYELFNKWFLLGIYKWIRRKILYQDCSVLDESRLKFLGMRIFGYLNYLK